jgi:hypothetical protein
LPDPGFPLLELLVRLVVIFGRAAETTVKPRFLFFPTFWNPPNWHLFRVIYECFMNSDHFHQLNPIYEHAIPVTDSGSYLKPFAPLLIFKKRVCTNVPNHSKKVTHLHLK